MSAILLMGDDVIVRLRRILNEECARFALSADDLETMRDQVLQPRGHKDRRLVKVRRRIAFRLLICPEIIHRKKQGYEVLDDKVWEPHYGRLSYPEMAAAFGGNHSTWIHLARAVRARARALGVSVLQLPDVSPEFMGTDLPGGICPQPAPASNG